MANDFTGSQWKVDTPYSTSPSPGHIVNSSIRVSSLTWTSMAAGAQVIIQDRNGKTIINSTDAQANVPVVLSSPQWVEGFFVPTLTSGIITAVVSAK